MKTRSWFVVAGLLLAIASPVQGQSFTVGGEAGLNFSDFSVDPDLGLDVESESGFTLGAVVGYDFAPAGLIGVQSGLSFSQKGATISPADTDDEADVDLDYLEVPLLGVLNIPVSGTQVAPRLYAGGILGFELSCDLAVVDVEDAVTTSGECDAPGFDENRLETNGVDFGFLFGGGVGFDTGPGQLILDARFNVGLTDINDTPDPSPVEIKNRTFQLLGGYRITLP